MQQLLGSPCLKKVDSDMAVLKWDLDRGQPTWLLLGSLEAQVLADCIAVAGKICKGFLGALVLQCALD